MDKLKQLDHNLINTSPAGQEVDRLIAEYVFNRDLDTENIWYASGYCRIGFNMDKNKAEEVAKQTNFEDIERLQKHGLKLFNGNETLQAKSYIKEQYSINLNEAEKILDQMPYKWEITKNIINHDYELDEKYYAKIDYPDGTVIRRYGNTLALAICRAALTCRAYELEKVRV